MTGPNIKLHSELGASKSERWWNCPGSVNAERGVFAPAGPYAIEGTAAHELAERCLRNDGVTPFALVGMTLPVTVEVREGECEVQQIEVTDEMAEAVSVYVDYCRERIDEVQQTDAGTFYIEQQFDLAPINPPEPMFGTADFVAWNPATRHLEVVDYKHGKGVVVEAEKNKQFLQYALGAVIALGKRPKTIRVTVVQPRAPHEEGVIRHYDFGWDELVAYKKELLERARATQAPDAPRVVGDWCRFCKVAATCPSQREHAIAVVQSEFDVIERPEAVLVAPDKLTDEQISRILSAANAVEGWFDAIRRYVAEKIEQGVDVPGWKLVAKRATRKWEDPAKVERVLSLMPGVDEAEIYAPRKLISPKQAEDLLKRKRIQYDLTPYILKTSSGTNLVPADDPRPAALPSAQTEFSVEPVAEGSEVEALLLKSAEIVSAAKKKKAPAKTR